MGSNLDQAPPAPYIADGVGYIPLCGHDGVPRAWALVDPEDVAYLAEHRWHLTDTGYACRWFGGRPPNRKRWRMHRWLVNLPAGDRRQVDHINRNRLDNRRANLRVVRDDAQNRQNMPSRGGSSEYRGVHYDAERGKWMAQAKAKGAGRLARRFDTEAEAAQAALAWRREHMPWAVD